MRLRNRSRYLTAALILALTALAILPMTSEAETSSEIIYHTPGAPSLESHPEAPRKPVPSTKSHSPAPHAATPTPHKPKAEPETTEPSSEPEGEAETAHREKSKVAPAGKGGNRPPGGGSHHGQKPASKKQVGTPQASETPSQLLTSSTGANASQAGGSSPVVPILIAMAVLAALSIGVVLYRERKGQAGASA
jgi:outer membrane biosynthesis protein TonB